MMRDACFSQIASLAKVEVTLGICFEIEEEFVIMWRDVDVIVEILIKISLAISVQVVQTDKFNVADEADAKAHQYDSPDASKPYEIVSRYELGVDHLKDQEVYPAQKMVGRATTGESTFVMKIDPDNWGVMLRRTLDYQFPNQRAEVLVSDADAKEPNWQPAGVWYTAGSNKCIYSNPRQELGVFEPKIEISNRRFRDDEFLIGRDLTRGKKAIRIRVKFTPVNRPVIQGEPVDPQAWSEIRYAAYCFGMPKAP